MRINFSNKSFEYNPEYKLGLIDTCIDIDKDCKVVEIDDEHLFAFEQIVEGKFIDYNCKNIDEIEQINESLNYLLYGDIQKWYQIAIIRPLSDIIMNKKSVEAFFERHIDKVNWDYLSRNRNISEAYFERHIDKVNWVYLSSNENISEAFFKRHIDKAEWEYLSSNRNISEAFFERHIDKIDWDYLSSNRTISEEFFERHIDKVDWDYLSENKFRCHSHILRKRLLNTNIFSFDSEWKKLL